MVRPEFKRPAKLGFCRFRISGIPEQGDPERHRLGSSLRGGKGLELLLPFCGSSALYQKAAQQITRSGVQGSKPDRFPQRRFRGGRFTGGELRLSPEMQGFGTTTGTACTSTILRKTRDRLLRMANRSFRIRSTEGDCAKVVVRKGVVRFAFDHRAEHFGGFGVAAQPEEQRGAGYGERNRLRGRDKRSAQSVFSFGYPVGARKELGKSSETTGVLGQTFLEESDCFFQPPLLGKPTRCCDVVFLESGREAERTEQQCN